MDSFEIPSDGYDLSPLHPRQPSLPIDLTDDEPTSDSLGRIDPDRLAPVGQPQQRRRRTSTQRPATPKTQYTQVPPIETAQPQPAVQPRAAEPTSKSESLSSIGPAVGAFFGDGRWRIFFGILLLLVSLYMAVVSISYIQHGAADQSIIQNQTAAQIAANNAGVENTGGWVGAMMSHMLIYRWLGIGGFVIIFYLIALALTLLHIIKTRFFALTFKCLISAFCLSVIAGLLTYNSASPLLWGGEVGMYLNDVIVRSASMWAATGTSILAAAIVVLIFLEPVKRAVKAIGRFIRRQRNKMADRYSQSRAAARASVERERNAREETHSEDTTADETPADEPQPVNPVKPAAVQPLEDLPFESRETISPEPEPAPRPAPLTQLEDIPSSYDTTPIRNGGLFDDTAEAPAAEVPTVETSEQPDTPSANLVETTPAPVLESIETTADNQTEADIDESEEVDLDQYDPTADLSNYRFPSLQILHNRNSSYSLSEEEQEENNQRIITTLQSYGVEISSIKATVGPTITLYEIIPAPGTRISKIKRLGDDMALSLAALGIRIIAPMPGKGTIGMEVPNKHPQAVGIRAVLSSKAYHESTAELPLALGTTISNEVFVCDLAKMPHLLVAGATGMGKSVGLNAIIASLLFKKHPAELKFVLVDPKMVEFSLYNCLEKHFLAKLPGDEDPVLTDPTKVLATLNSLCVEMDNRYKLLSQAKLRGIKEYNQKFISRHLNPQKGHRYLPYIVVIIDEFADLMITAGKQIEEPIVRIAQKARAVGIHLILATQRPSVNVITGVIKANFPGRMAFRVTQMNDSRTIIDRPGAEQLIGRGDMLISRDGMIDRVQCAFIDTDEVEELCESISRQQGYLEPYPLPEVVAPGEGGQLISGALGDRDDMFADAGRAVIEAGQGSASLLQRQFKIGYPRAGKLIDQLAAAGVVGPVTAAGKPRQVLMDMYSFEQLLNQQ